MKKGGPTVEDIRRRRKEVTIQLRKSKRDEDFFKRRNISESMLNTDEDQDLIDDLKRLAHDAADETDPARQLAAVREARNLLTNFNTEPPVDELVACGILPTLVKCLLQPDRLTLQFEAVWALTNVAAGTSEHTQKVVDTGCGPILVHLLSSPSLNVCEQAVWALGNIAGDGQELRDYVLALGALKPMLSLVRSDVPTSFLRNIIWVIVNLCRKYAKPLPPGVVHQILQKLDMLLDHYDAKIISNSIWAISYLADGGNELLNIVINSGILPKAIPLLGHPENKVQAGAVRVVGIISSGTDEQAQAAVDHGALEYFPGLLSHPINLIRKEASWCLANLTAGTQSQLQAVLDMDLLPEVIHNLSHSDFRIGKEAAYTVTNLAVIGNQNQLKALLKENFLEPFCRLLCCPDAEILNVVLEGLDNVLKRSGNYSQELANQIEECGALDWIERCQNHESLKVYSVAYEIIDKFFSADTNLGPESDEIEFHFSIDAPMEPFDF